METKDVQAARTTMFDAGQDYPMKESNSLAIPIRGRLTGTESNPGLSLPIAHRK
jgi:hypothetical protein